MDRTERQKLGIKRWIDSGGKGTLCWCTGVGKTYGACMLINAMYKRNPNLSVLIAVPTDVLKNQWNRELAKNRLFSICKVEIFNTIVKQKYNVDLFIIDELHTAASPVNITMFNVVKYRYFLGLTATFERLDGNEKLLEKYTSICDKITIEEAVANNWLSNYRNYKVLLNVDLTEYKELDRSFHSLFSIFNFNFKLAMNCLQYKTVAAAFAKKVGKNPQNIQGFAMQWNRLLRKRKAFVMSHEKKFEVANKILDFRTNKKCITFSATIKDAETFKSKNALILHSKQRKKENKEIMETFNSMQTGILSTSKSADAGVDIKGLSVGIILSGDSSKTRMTQRIGRIIRYEKNKISEMFTLVIKGTIDEIWFNNSNIDQPYITINEQQLDIILNGKEISTRPKRGITDIDHRY